MLLDYQYYMSKLPPTIIICGDFIFKNLCLILHNVCLYLILCEMKNIGKTFIYYTIIAFIRKILLTRGNCQDLEKSLRISQYHLKQLRYVVWSKIMFK